MFCFNPPSRKFILLACFSPLRITTLRQRDLCPALLCQATSLGLPDINIMSVVRVGEEGFDDQKRQPERAKSVDAPTWPPCMSNQVRASSLHSSQFGKIPRTSFLALSNVKMLLEIAIVLGRRRTTASSPLSLFVRMASLNFPRAS